ncbi:MAG: hypothetical protein GAK28_02943 [Luteibacter sp.]|nr:MAG: hypothetical protein GAK28_02943 [Luteibacter sp.]
MPTAALAVALVRTSVRRAPRNPVVQALSLAARIEPDAELRADWFHHDPIRELGGLTAEGALATGQGAALVRVLRAIDAGRRG